MTRIEALDAYARSIRVHPFTVRLLAGVGVTHDFRPNWKQKPGQYRARNTLFTSSRVVDSLI